MIGIGAANVVAGFQGFPVSTSGSRIAVAEQASSKSQLTGLVGAAAIRLVLVFAAGCNAVRATADLERHRHSLRAISG
jgi:MFS superfamily sulfate permease-like transporter